MVFFLGLYIYKRMLRWFNLNLLWFTLQDIQVYCGGALHLESIRHGGAKIWTRMAILSAIFVSHQQDLSCSSRFHEDTSSIVHMDSTVCFLCLLNFDLYIYMCMHAHGISIITLNKNGKCQTSQSNLSLTQTPPARTWPSLRYDSEASSSTPGTCRAEMDNCWDQRTACWLTGPFYSVFML